TLTSRRHWNLNPARLPIPPRPLIRCDGPRNNPSPSATNCIIEKLDCGYPQVTAQFIDVTTRSNIILGFVSGTVVIDHNGGTDETFVDSAIVLFLTPGTIGFSYRIIFIGQDREI